MIVTVSATLLAGLLALGIWERRARDRAHAAIPIRIHVNGTRGKSTVTRLIAGALREAGLQTIAKTTGTAPRLILSDGSERIVRRRAPASVREQLWLLREAQRAKAAALVVECMAVDPELQAVSEDDMIRATIGVITNARLDHGEVMGPTIEQVATALARTIPRAGDLVVGPTGGIDVLERAARARGSRVVHAVADAEPAESGPAWFADDVRIALAVARLLGIADEIARRGMLRASPDPGGVHTGAVEVASRRVEYVDASAANDPQSLDLVLDPRSRDALFVFHHRRDRPARLRQFGDARPWSRDGDTVVVTGDRPDWATWHRLRRQLPAGRLTFAAPFRVAADIRRRLSSAPGPGLLVFCGNTKGFRRDLMLAGLQRA